MPTTINALTYNMSFATQINKALASEADFVEACQQKYKRGGFQCIENAVKNIGKLPNLDLVGIQELNSDVDKSIMKVQENLDKFERGKTGLATVSILWNSDIFGKVKYKKVFNLFDGDSRPCLILIMENNFILVNMHFPWSIRKHIALKNLKNGINKDKRLRKAFYDNDDAKIIMLGDFNDNNTTITKNKPLVLKSSSSSKQTIRLRHIKTREQARKTMRSCCWHKPKHKYKYFSDTGDYILVNKNIKQTAIGIPSIFKVRGRNNRLFSDHMPVMAKLNIGEN